MDVGVVRRRRELDPQRLDTATVDRLVTERVRGSLGYWDGVTHQHCFALPKYIRQAIDAQTRISTDANPLIVT